MDQFLSEKLTFALIIFLVSLFAGLLPLSNFSFANLRDKATSFARKDFIIGEALASGVFLGAALLHMLNEAARDFFLLDYKYPVAFLLAGIVFLTLLLLEHIGREVNEHSGNNNILFVILSVIMLSIHSLLEGVALGIRTDFSLIVIIFIAIIAHKWAASYSLAVQIKKNNLSKHLSWVLFMIFALMTPVGIFFGNIINSGLNLSEVIAPIFTSLAAGTFLYIGTLHGLNRAVMIERCCNLNDYIFVIIGFGLMAVVGIWV